MNRRSLILGLSASLAAPAIVKADSLMKLWVPKPDLLRRPSIIVPGTISYIARSNF